MTSYQNDDGVVEKERSVPIRDHPVRTKSLLAFWILGLCNNYGYVVMLSAASDIIKRNFDSVEEGPNNPERNCNTISTGAILLADIIPSLTIKLIAPFFPLWIHFRMIAVLLLSITGFIMVAEAHSSWVAITGVVSIALSSGLGEATMLSYMGLYKSIDVISNWSSGTGGAGFFGSLTYMGLSLIFAEEDRAKPLYIFLIVPLLMGISFWVLLDKPEFVDDTVVDGRSQETFGFPSSTSSLYTTEESGMKRFLSNVKAIPPLLKYMIPLCLVYLFEYFINQGMLFHWFSEPEGRKTCKLCFLFILASLFELIQFPDFGINVKDQYVWYQLDYQIGVFISRSSIKLFEIKRTWILALLQGINVIIFTTTAIYNYIPFIYIVFLLILYEGFLGGASYVNTYNRIQHEVEADKREFSMGITSLADAIGISLAGFLAMPAHNAICKLPKY